MSIDHSYHIGGDEKVELAINVFGVDDTIGEKEIKASIYAYEKETGKPKFTCILSESEIKNLYHHLSQYSIVRDSKDSLERKFIEVSGDAVAIQAILQASKSEETLVALSAFIKSSLSNHDINIILGRRESLAEFKSKMEAETDIPEPEWQKFFEANDWIFGYGLNYKFLKILQRESHLSSANADGTNQVIADFLLSDNRFTKIVEIKKPSTPLFKARQNRSDAWCLSNELSDAVSQILSQKANWDITSAGVNYTSGGKRIEESTYDVECILIIGKISDITGDDRERAMKKKTLELYRRNLRNIDILFYDELYERAEFIVEYVSLKS